MLSRYYHVDVKKLERLLVERGWAAGEIAARAPFSQRTVDKIMQGGRVFRSSLKRLADVFKVKPEELVQSGPHDARRDESEAATFNVNLSNVPEGFDETSQHIHQFLYLLRTKLNGGDGDVVDYLDNGDKVTITIELDRKVLFGMFMELMRGQLQHLKPGGDPGTIQPGASEFALLLWWVDDIQFPADCPLQELRGKSVTAKDKFTLAMP